MDNKFKLKAPFRPKGDQPKAISKLLNGLAKKFSQQTLLGVTGSGKTFTVANVIAKIQKPTLVIAHNKTLAAQLAQEYRSFFPDNAVEYFVSYYDYYQPEAYIPSTDTYIEKEAQINEEIDRLRHNATQSILNRRDTIVVASVSCIYNIGSPDLYLSDALKITLGSRISREDLIDRLTAKFFVRTRNNLRRGSFRVIGSNFEVMPINEEREYRIIVEKGIVKEIIELNPITKESLKKRTFLYIFPARHYVTDPQRLERAIAAIKAEAQKRVRYFKANGKLIEADRIERRVTYDMEMLKEVGYINGIENYSRHLDGRTPGSRPHTLLEYFPKDFLVVIDESHVTIPQIRGMYFGDKSRKETLIEHGFRLPSALDNRPLKFDEFEGMVNSVIYTSATPAEYEVKRSQQVVEQIVRPTGLVDPKLKIKPIRDQIKDLVKRIKKRIEKKQRVLITTLTKKMAEDLSEYLKNKGYKVHYLHSDVDTLDRIDTLSKLRRGGYDIVVGVNLLREGLDLPEVSLVAILDADKEGFLRSQISLIQTIGRAARNVDGEVILYADVVTKSIAKAVEETERRRKLQLKYNKKHGITPTTIKKEIKDIAQGIKSKEHSRKVRSYIDIERLGNVEELEKVIHLKRKEMNQAAKKLDFELAALLRDEIVELKKKQKRKAGDTK